MLFEDCDIIMNKLDYGVPIYIIWNIWCNHCSRVRLVLDFYMITFPFRCSIFWIHISGSLTYTDEVKIDRNWFVISVMYNEITTSFRCTWRSISKLGSRLSPRSRITLLPSSCAPKAKFIKKITWYYSTFQCYRFLYSCIRCRRCSCCRINLIKG